ncbi:ABC transporter ATP-binding protein [Nocardiopsis coralliicola]
MNNSDLNPLELEDVSKFYRTGDEVVRALDGVTVHVGPGEFAAVTGPSGSGKSTLLHCASGLDSVDKGTVLLGGGDITRMNDRQLTRARRTTAGFIFQAYNLMSGKSAQDNMVYPLKLQGAKVDGPWFQQVVDSLGIGDLLARYPNQMSGGQQQRVAVARSMMSRPKIVFADEPTGALDSGTSNQLLDLFSWCSTEMGQAIMMVTHDLDAAKRAHRTIEMVDGRIDRVH